MTKTPIDPALKKVLQDFSLSYQAKRRSVLQGHDFEVLRTALAALKDRALDRSDELLALFEERARAHGSRVLRARDGAEANAHILRICRDHGVRKMVKCKSMVSEETGLNGFLAKHGIEARETDLGEWIVQLASHRPTHMVLPAIHMTRGDVAALFSAALGHRVPDDIPSLVRIARGEVRREIFSSQAGLSGANTLIAENGAIMLVTNEGNGRLVTTVPPVHIVLASLEKVVPAVEDALMLLQLLPRNATGQAITSYVSFIAGPHAAAQYIILLDNHRSEMRADPEFRAALRCIKCSACLNVCPVYQLIGGEEYSHIYMGGIGTLFTAWIHGLEASKVLAKVCLRCHRCEDYCATKIPIADLITALAGRLKKDTGVPLWKRIVFDGVLGRPGIQATAFAAARKGRKMIARKDGFSRRLPGWLKKYDRFRALPAPAVKPFSKMFTAEFGPGRGAAPAPVAAAGAPGFVWGSVSAALNRVFTSRVSAPDLARGSIPPYSPADLRPRANGEPEARPLAAAKGPVTIFGGCLVEHVYPEIGLAAARVLTKLGFEVHAAPGLCCGFPPSNAGFRTASGKAFSALLKKIEIRGPVVTVCPTCTTMLSKRGAEVVGSEKAKELAARVIPFSRFIAENEKSALSRLRGKTRALGSLENRTSSGSAADRSESAEQPAGSGELVKFTYHDSCHHRNILRADRASRELLECALGGGVVEMDEPDKCCGFAGSYTVDNPEISAGLLADKLAAIERTGADIVALDCPGCLLQIRGGCRSRGLAVRVAHTAELLDQVLT